MALGPKELYGSEVSQKPNLRAFPYEGGISPGKLAALTGAPDLPHLTPLAYNEVGSEWDVFDEADVNLDEIAGFLWRPESTDQPTDATNETLVQILRRGQIHASDVPLPTTAAQAQPALDAALIAAGVRHDGLDVRGLEGAH